MFEFGLIHNWEYNIKSTFTVYESIQTLNMHLDNLSSNYCLI